jgi:hypothetical protein
MIVIRALLVSPAPYQIIFATAVAKIDTKPTGSKDFIIDDAYSLDDDRTLLVLNRETNNQRLGPEAASPIH